jgi:hypothetical protein
MKSKISYRILLASVIVLFATQTRSQILPPPTPPPPVAIPIDGGVLLVIGACGIYGAIQLKRKINRN